MSSKTKIRRRVIKKQSKGWLSPAKVERVTFSKGANGKRVKIGEGNYGNVYVGRMKFRDGTVHRVAIKRFKNNMDDKLASSYQRTIKRLRDLGIPLPKMGMVKIKSKTNPDGEWVQVSQLWGSTKNKSKIVSRGKIKTPKGKRDTANILTKMANSGYLVFLDMIEPFNHAPGVIPIDIDKFVPRNQKEMRMNDIPKINDIAQSLYGIIDLISANKEERKQLLKLSINLANPNLKKSLKKINSRTMTEERLLGSD